VEAQDVQRWTVRLLSLYSDAYARNQFRALQQFFRWLAAEDGIGDPMARLRPPRETPKPVPCFTSVELSKLRRACLGSSFEERRDAAIIAVFLAMGIRLSEMAGIRYHPGDSYRSDVDLAAREVTVRGKGGKSRTVKLSHEAARRLDRYLRARSGHELAWRPELWLGEGTRGPLDGPGSTSWWCGAAASAGCCCTRTGSGITSARRGKWAELHWTQHSPRSAITMP
jgi:integrase/recombinase XerD